MNRDIKFRGKRIDTGEWIYGYYVKHPRGIQRIYLQPFDEAVSNTWYYVDENSVGQFTGLSDINGREIYEGDILGETFMNDGVEEFSPIPVLWDEKDSMFAVDLSFLRDGTYLEPLSTNYQGLPIIGNIFENIELLKND